jgi:dimethylamine monooxygenase subunit A
MQPGLRRKAPGDAHFHLLSPASARFAEKLAALTHDARRCVLIKPGFDARPALRALAQVLAEEHPHAFSLHDNTLICLKGEASISLEDCEVSWEVLSVSSIYGAIKNIPFELQAWALLCLCIEQDLAVIQAPAGTLGLLAVCTPSHWAPETKIGLSFAHVHAPVADNTLLIKAAEGLMKLVTGADAWERFVWTITPSARYDAHPARHPGRVWPKAQGRAFAEQCFLRWERQSFIPLPHTAQAVFGIHIRIAPLLIAVDQADTLSTLHLSLQSMSDAVLEYRGLSQVRDALLQGLAHSLATS